MGGRGTRIGLDATGGVDEVVMNFERVEEISAQIWSHVYSSAYAAHVRQGASEAVARLNALAAAQDAVSNFLAKKSQFATQYMRA